MASLIPKTNGTVGSATPPSALALQTGEVAENKYSGRLYMKQENGTVVDPAKVQLTGDVTGTTAAPTSATDGGTVSCTVGKLQNRTVASTAPTANQTLVWDGTQWAPGNSGGLQMLTSVSASGSAVDITGIPSFATTVVVNFSILSSPNSATAYNYVVRLGTSAGIWPGGTTAHCASNAVGTALSANSVLSIPFNKTTGNAAVTNQVSGTLVLRKLNSTDTWVAEGTSVLLNDLTVIMYPWVTSGIVYLPAVLDRLQVTQLTGITFSPTTFNGGTISVWYS